MKCPYCTEEIKDEAIVCHYCRRDLTFFKPIEVKLQSLRRDIEEKLQSLEKKIDDITVSLNDVILDKSTNIHPVSKTPIRISVLIIALQTIFMIMIRLGRYLGKLSSEFAFISYVISLLASGSWFGYTLRGTDFKRYLYIGASIGLIIDMLLVLIPRNQSESLGFDLISILISIALSTLLFTTGCLLGNLIENIRYPELKQAGFAVKLAENFILKSKDPIKTDGLSTAASNDTIKKLSTVIAAIAPVLTVMGSIIVALIQHLAKKSGTTP